MSGLIKEELTRLALGSFHTKLPHVACFTVSHLLESLSYPDKYWFHVFQNKNVYSLRCRGRYCELCECFKLSACLGLNHVIWVLLLTPARALLVLQKVLLNLNCTDKTAHSKFSTCNSQCFQHLHSEGSC